MVSGVEEELRGNSHSQKKKEETQIHPALSQNGTDIQSKNM